MNSHTPAAPPPEGVTPNFVDPQGSNYEIYSISIALCSTATLVLLARLYTRAVILRALSLDDLCCVMGQICAWIFAILSILNIQNGYGYHIWDLYIDKLTLFKQYDLAEEDVYCVGVWFVKTSILLFYLRLSPEKQFRRITYAIMLFVACYSIISLLVFTLPCQPISGAWDVSKMAEAKCIDEFAFVYANAAFNIFSDVVTLILPVRLCWSLQTSLRQKAMLLVVLVMGSFACIVACVRIITMMPFIHSNDFTWFKVTLAKWCMVEINVGIICSCLPIVRPLLMRTLPILFSTMDKSSGNQSSEGSYQLKGVSGRKFRNWDHLTTIGTTQGTVDRDEDEESKGMIRKESSKENGIVKSVDYTVTAEK